MKIKNILVKNFKSFKEQEINFENLTVIIGGNASGKSNIITLFRFVSNIVKLGVDDAISMLGGTGYLTNTMIGSKVPTYLKYTFGFDDDKEDDKKMSISSILASNRLKQLIFEVEITPGKNEYDYIITKDNLSLVYDLIDVKDSNLIYGEFNFSFNKNNGDVVSDVIYLPLNKTSDDILKDISKNKDFLLDNAKYFNRIIGANHELSIRSIKFILPEIAKYNNFVNVYNFDPKELKKASPITSFRNLEESGSNLASVLQKIIKNPEENKKLLTIINDCLPFISKIEVENPVDKMVSYVVKEVYNDKKFDSSFLSDGTVTIIAIIIALYFNDDSSIIVLEEPERNLHPKLLRKLLEMVEDVSSKKQIIITTHNPELIKHTTLKSILFTKREENGFTVITRPEDSETVRIFISNELGLDDLFIQDLLGD